MKKNLLKHTLFIAVLSTLSITACTGKKANESSIANSTEATKESNSASLSDTKKESSKADSEDTESSRRRRLTAVLSQHCTYGSRIQRFQ